MHIERPGSYRRTLATETIGNNKTFNFASADTAPIISLRIKNYGSGNTIFIPATVEYFFYRGKPCTILGGLGLNEINVPYCILGQFCICNLDKVSICGTGTNNFIDCGEYRPKKIDDEYNIRLFTFNGAPLYFEVPPEYAVCIEHSYDQQFVCEPGYYSAYNGTITRLDHYRK